MFGNGGLAAAWGRVPEGFRFRVYSGPILCPDHRHPYPCDACVAATVKAVGELVAGWRSRPRRRAF